MRNPHFDDGLIVWKDEYTGRYKTPDSGYNEQFELQWKLALETRPEYYQHPGASTEDDYIADRIYEWTGKHPNGTGFKYPVAGSRVLDHPLDVDLIRGKDCIDVGCGLGRWTKVMMALGAKSVLSVDMSDSALKSVRRFNEHVRRVNVMEIPTEHTDIVGQFDFANFWGVAMCTHDPSEAFSSAASTVKPGGALYVMMYAPTGMHGTHLVNLQRKIFHSLDTVEERLAFVEHVYRREWDRGFPLYHNLRNMLRRILRRPKDGKIGTLDMLEPFYNWVIPIETMYDWMKRAGFREIVHLNEYQKRPCAYHVLGKYKE
jgi:SAM-dependent methyltransferase